MTIHRFEELKVWQLARAFRKKIYDITSKMPKEEKYALISNMRDAACSITRNIAEGFGRYHLQENIQFCRQSRGSLNEVLDDLYTSLDAGHVSQEVFTAIYESGREVERVLNGYINSMVAKKQTEQ
jgi:four helix bundle protein